MNRVGPFQPSQRHFTTLIRQAFCVASMVARAAPAEDRVIAATITASVVGRAWALRLAFPGAPQIRPGRSSGAIQPIYLNCFPLKPEGHPAIRVIVRPV
jgi:hypothetical protein